MSVLQIDRKEILRYLGYRNTEADDTVRSSIESVLEELQRAAAPKSVTRDITIKPIGSDAVEIAGAVIRSKSLFQHLESCRSGVLFAATLGAPVDLLIQRYSVLDMSRAVIAQACAAAMIEAFCDECQTETEQQAYKQGLFLRPRYSPGYGDFPLSYQKLLLEMLNAQRRIGLTRTESDMLVPTKSVTAVIGFTTEPTGCHTAKCMTCTATDCPFRKE